MSTYPVTPISMPISPAEANEIKIIYEKLTNSPIKATALQQELRANTENARNQEGQGLKYDGEKPRMELVSSFAIEELAKVLTFGAKKYSSRNWENGFAWTRAIAAILRHTYAYLRGETHDPETGLSHMAHVLCEAMFLVHFEKTKPELDDRPKYA